MKIRDMLILSILASLILARGTSAFSIKENNAFFMHGEYGTVKFSCASPTRRSGFFKDLLDKAFENDSNISQDDIRKGQLEGPGSGDNTEASARRVPLTATQEKWRQIDSTIPNLEMTTFDMDFYLSGVPNKDPSNDLFGSRVNVSSRDRQVGLQVPDKPTVSSIRVEFMPENKCRCLTDSDFTLAGTDDDWKVSDDGKQVRFRIEVSGYTRTIETKGTIQKIYWSQDEDQTSMTSTTYSIPPGWMYGEASLSRTVKGGVVWSDCVLKIEQSVGIFGAASKMIPCGKFEVRDAPSTSS